MKRSVVLQLFILLSFVQDMTGQSCNSVDLDERDNCGFNGISRRECEDLEDDNDSCCWDNSAPKSVWCFKRTPKAGSDNQVISIGGLRITLPDFEGCRLGTIFQNGKSIVEGFLSIARSGSVGEAITNVFSNAKIFTVGAYCGLFSNAVDAITGCIRPFISPFAAIFPTVGTTFFSIMNGLEVVKAPCQILSGEGLPLSRAQCIPAAARICPVNSVEVLTAFSSFDSSDIEATCASFERTLTGVVDCIEDATEGCPEALRDEFKGIMNTYLDITEVSDEYCTSGCYDYILFIADEHPTCTWNIPRIYPNPEASNYCEYAHYMAQCSWLLHSGCPLLPESIFQRSISVVDIALNVGGCLPLELEDYEPNEDFQINLPPCVEASIYCGQNLAELIGITRLAGPFAGYTTRDVQDTVKELGEDLKKGNFRALCGSESQRDDGVNPIQDCINDLTDSCAPDAEENRALRIAGTAADWFGEACVPGCYELFEDFKLFSARVCADVEINTDEFIRLENLLDKALRATVLGDVDSVEECRVARAFVECTGRRIQECTFLHNRLLDARRFLIERIYGPGTRVTRTYEICGIILDYPLVVTDGGTLFRPVSSGRGGSGGSGSSTSAGQSMHPRHDMTFLASCLSLIVINLILKLRI